GAADTFEKFVAGGLDPFTNFGSVVGGGDGPVGFEAAEVVEADDVVEIMGAARAVNPPIEAVVAHFIPFVERVSPALASSGEVVGRDAGDPNRSEVFVQFEEVGASPDVGAVVVDEDGNVADELDAALRAVGAEGTPL